MPFAQEPTSFTSVRIEASLVALAGVTTCAAIDTPPHPLYSGADVPMRTITVREEVPMSLQQADGWTRRSFWAGLAMAGEAGLLGLHARPVTA